jgi:SNF2 family DNA or RNA helicase
MFREDLLLQIFSEETSGNNHIKGQRVLNNDLVSSINITSKDNIISINSEVISENLFNEYYTNINLEVFREKVKINATSCSCLDYEKNGQKKKNYCCKHLVASYYKAIEQLVEHPLLSAKTREEDILLKNKGNALSILLADERDKEELKIEVYLNKDEWSQGLSAEFKIGLYNMGSSNLYSLKDINQFIISYYNHVPIEYSKYFTFHIKTQRLGTKDKRIIDFIELLKTLEGNSNFGSKIGENYIGGKFINIPDFLIRQFLEVIENHKVYLNDGFYYRPIETEILHDNPAIDFDLKNIKDNYVLKSPSGMPVALSSKNDAFLLGTTIYLPDYEFCYKLSPYMQLFHVAKVITLPDTEEEKILRKLIPDLYFLSNNVTLAKPIKDKIVMEQVEFNFYFDKIEQEITLVAKTRYGAIEFNMIEDYTEKIIFRDLEKEKQVFALLRNLGFEENGGRFYFIWGDDYKFRFFKSEVERLQKYGEVYYSDSFKGLKAIGKSNINGDIRAGKYNYFEMEFTIDDIPKAETSHILRAFRDNLKYYKLKSGEYLDLEELELRKFLKLIDVVSGSTIKNNQMEIPKSKGIYLYNYLEEQGIRYIKGKAELEELSNKLKNLGNPNSRNTNSNSNSNSNNEGNGENSRNGKNDSQSQNNPNSKATMPVPAEFKGTFREYQKTGYHWLKTLDYLGFGGILGDEMGLGKTIQAIGFILSNKGSKSLIVTPTSLTYNWISEFEKFAPSLSVVAVNGPKQDREEITKNLKDHDVVITTYNLLKRDIENYKPIEFDYCILDEAQYIKNAHSQNAKAVKEINARTRFALSGTPMENSLMELWSIFDFIMPGYLYDEKRFSVRYHKKLKENPEVLEQIKELIKPFVLRRRKKEVLKELPDKIETKVIVELEEEQRKIYATYAKHAVELIEKKVKDMEFENSKIEILAYITKLRQLCLDPSVVMKDYSGGSGKIEALVELLHQSIEEGHKILVFSQFTSILKNIGKRIKAEKISYSYLDGAVPSEKRMKLVKDFNEGNNNESVFLISLKAGGVGLNLTSADIVIHFDPWWNPAVEDQATDRAHRIGQKNVVEVIKIIAQGTIEEKILLLQEEKKKLISELMGDGDELTNVDVLKSLSEKELLGLFEIHR